MAGFEDFFLLLEQYQVTDVLLPFLLIFVIVFAVLQKMRIIGEGKKQFNVVVALIIALLTVIPHVTGGYPSGYDVVEIINEILPSVSLIAVAAISVLILLGIFSIKFAESATPIIGILAVLFILYVIGSALNYWSSPSDVFNWWSSETTSLIIIILVFGLIVWFVVREEKPGSAGEGLMEGFKKLFERV